jgi:hypothetical protein
MWWYRQVPKRKDVGRKGKKRKEKIMKQKKEKRKKKTIMVTKVPK